tara:strand:+ start:68994 stop:73262 length:4269 start_codon:yes stop_codon:yes gene_type:complete
LKSFCKTYSLIFAILFSFAIRAQERIDFNYIDGNQGLSENIVNDITQDQNGFIWLATNDGLNRYDGYKMTYFRYDPENQSSLSSNVLESLWVSKKGMLWIGTSDGGLNRYNPINNSFKRFQNDPEDETTIPVGIVDDVTEDTNGNIWVIIRSKGVYRLQQNKNRTEFIFYDIKEALPNRPVVLTASKRGGVWVSTLKGIIHLSDKTPINLSFSEWQNELLKQGKAVIESENGSFWFVYHSGKIINASISGDLDSYNNTLVIHKELFTDNLSAEISLSEDQERNIWLSANKKLLKISNKGVFTYESGKFPYNNLLNTKINCTFIDRSNVLWLGTYNKGALNFDIRRPPIYSLDDLSFQKKNKENSFFNNAIHSFCEDKFGALWIGTEGGGLLRVRNGLNAFIDSSLEKKSNFDFFEPTNPSDLLVGTNIYSLFSDSKNRVWIGTENGITCFQFNKTYQNNRNLQNKDFNVKHFYSKEINFKKLAGNEVYYITEDDLGTIWVASWDGGLQRFLEKENRFEAFQHNPHQKGTISHNTIRSIVFEPNGEAWIGTAGGGLNKMIFPEGREGLPYFLNFKHDASNKESISNNYILDLVKDKEDNLWISTFGGGLNKMILDDKKQSLSRFKRYTTKNQLPSNTIKAMLFDDANTLWASTNRDVFQMDVSSGEILQVLNASQFKLDEFKDHSKFKFKDGSMIFGGINDLGLFYPKKLKIDTTQIKASITKIFVDNVELNPNNKNNAVNYLEKTIQYTDRITLPYDKNTIEIEFSGMEFSNPTGVKYKYFLEGYDDVSLVSSDRNVRYTKIPSGNYVFHVKASKNAFNWSGEEKILAITIQPPFWLTTYAYLFYFVIAIIIGVAIYRIIIFRVRLKSQIKIEHIKREESEKINNLKLQFFTNVSHELRTPLSLISNPADKLVADPDMNYEQHKMLKMIQRNSNRLQNLITQLLDFRKMESGILSLSLYKDDIIPFIYDIYKSFEEIAASKQINYRFSCDASNIVCLFDADKLEKIIYNLISNAFKFTPAGGTIILSLSKETIKGKGINKNITEHLKIQVSDTGIGIREEEQKNIFKRFYQAEDGKRGKVIGTGIGLSYTHNLVKLHHGEITFKSQLEKGTKFTIMLPLAEKVYKDYVVNKNTVLEKSEYLNDEINGLKDAFLATNFKTKEKQNLHKKQTLLLVEDNAELSYFVERELAKDYNVLVAENGLIGLELAKKHLPDLIISDLMMPEMDGIEMCEILKSEMKTCHIPIIILTAKAGLESEKRGLETGADEFVLKPFKIEILQLRIKNLLQTKVRLFKQFNLKADAIEFKEAKDSKDKDLIDLVKSKIIENLENSNFDVEELSKVVGMSRSSLYKKIKRITGMSTTELVRYVKLNEATLLLKQNKYSVEQVTYMVGFSDKRYFRDCFKKVYSKTPSEYIQELSNNIN